MARISVHISDFLRAAIGVELKTVAGRINFGSLILVTLLIVVLAGTDYIVIIAQLFGSELEPHGIDLVQILVIFMLIAFVCIGLCMLDEHLRHGRQRSPSDGAPREGLTEEEGE